jgi:SAM-dependent methyltransferase
MRYDEISQHRMYDELARLWPLISPPEDYEEESQFWRAALRAKLGPGQHRLLELGVGGGHNLSHFSREYTATAVDRSARMLEHSQRLNPGVEHLVGDMRTLRLGRTFDAVLVHDAIDYMVSLDDLRATFATAVAHLRPNGVFIVAPDYTRETFEDGAVYSRTTAGPSICLTHVEIDFDPDPSDTTLESLMLSLIREDGEIKVELDRHTIGLFSQGTWIEELTNAGFEVERWPTEEDDDPRQRSLYVGVLHPSAAEGRGRTDRGKATGPEPLVSPRAP